jgi:hypothetical protein
MDIVERQKGTPKACAARNISPLAWKSPVRPVGLFDRISQPRQNRSRELLLDTSTMTRCRS